MTRPSFALSRRDETLDRARAHQRDSIEYIRKQRDEGSLKPITSPLSAGVQAAETALGAGIVGYLAGRTGTTGIGAANLPLGLLAGGALLGASIYGLPDKIPMMKGSSGHVQNVAIGAIAGWFTLYAAGQGGQARARAGQPVAPIVAGVSPGPAYRAAPAYLPSSARFAHPVTGRAPLSEAELQGIAARY